MAKWCLVSARLSKVKRIDTPLQRTGRGFRLTDGSAVVRQPAMSESLQERVETAAALLEELGQDFARLADLDEALRVRLVAAAGLVSRPDRYKKKALSKAMARDRVQAKRAADQALLSQTGIRALRAEPVFRTPLPMPTDLSLTDSLRDTPADGEAEDAWAAAEASRADESAPVADTTSATVGAGARLLTARLCYVCKTEYSELHHFYDLMCPACAELNWKKRNQTADLRGRVALVTGARVKIGYQAAIKLLRAGADVLVVTRFPVDAARRFAREPDTSEWTSRLHIYGVDLRHTPSVEALCAGLLRQWSRLDALINNACQTVRRPAGWYDHVTVGEVGWSQLEPALRPMLERHVALAAGGALTGEASAPGNAIGPAGVWHSAILAQVPLLADDHVRSEHLYPAGRLDADLQQVDLRETNSWRMKLADVPTAELLEVQLVNAIAPFVLNARLRPLMVVPTRDSQIVNVSAMEGQFYRRWKTDKHPHTNMAKAALNMMTRTSAADYIADGIHMNSVDTGWVTDEDPKEIADRKARVHGFSPPLDIVDGAARIVAPVFEGIGQGAQVWGIFLKDYRPTPW